MNTNTYRIGFIGQGWIGRNYADDFEARGFETVRFGLEPEYASYKEKIADCDIVFIAVPTPTTPHGFDASILESVLPLVGKGKTAVIKSTVLPGTTERLSEKHPEIFIMHSPEFLSESTAAYDAAHPDRTIVGIPYETKDYRSRAEAVISVMPKASYSKIMNSRAAEFIKYAGNTMSYVKVVFVNMLYDLADSLNVEWSEVKEAVSADPRIGGFHLDPIHKSGRGAGGHCFIKDFAAFRELYAKMVEDAIGLDLLHALESKNKDLLVSTNKDLDLLTGVYGSLASKKVVSPGLAEGVRV